jgi:hypothetical protein
MAVRLLNSTIGISISDSPDLAELGLGARHLEDAMTRVARHVLAAGGTLMYGGDLRKGGFTELLFEFAATYKMPGASRFTVVNVLAWPVHVAMHREMLSSTIDAIEPWGTVVFLGLSGRQISKEQALMANRKRPTQQEWTAGLTSMRRWLTRKCDARVLLGGRVSEYKGLMPGIAEEALLSIKSKKPTYLAGGFGGCASDILNMMEIDGRGPVSRSPDWKGRETFRSFQSDDLHDGLEFDERRTLASTRHVDEIVALLMIGLGRQAKAQRAGKTRERKA